MSFFSRLFKSKAPETLEQRLLELEHFEQEQLLPLALSNEPDALRIAAIKKLALCTELVELATQASQSAQICSTARKRIGELLDTGVISVEQLQTKLNDQAALLALCGYSSQAGLALIEQIQNEDLLLEVAQHGSTTQVRQAASQKIEQRGNLEILFKQAKNKDKAVYKIIKSKLEIFKEEKLKEAQMADQINAICHQAELLTKRNVDEIFHARKKQIEEAWLQFASTAKQQASERYQQAIAQCQAKLDQIEEVERLLQQKSAEEDEAKIDVLRALDSLQHLIAKLYGDASPEVLQTELDDIRRALQEAIAQAKAKNLNLEKESKKAVKLEATAIRLLGNVQRHGSLSELVEILKTAQEDNGQTIKRQIEDFLEAGKLFDEESAPDIIPQTRAALLQWSNQVKEQISIRSEQVKKTAELLRRGDWAVAKGYVGRARAIFRDLEIAMQQLEQTPNHIAVKYDELKLAIDKLGDWHEFAVTPKKEDLAQQMEALVSSELPPKDLAEKIHTLQESWKELCRGGQNQDEVLWQRFHSAAQTAYEPCRKHFEEQTQVREQNATQRKTLLQQLSEYLEAYDWESANWKEVEKTLKISKEAWQSYWPIARKDIKALQSQFDAVMDALYGKLNAELDRNRAKKQALVEQAQALIEGADTFAAIESAKRLQSQWQAIGRCKRKDDQQLWKQFRQACDEIFERRNQESEALKKERNDAKLQAQDILQKMESISNMSGEAFFTAKAQLTTLTEAFQNIGELPRDDAKQISARYHELLNVIQDQTEQQRKNAALEMWHSIFKVANTIRQLEIETLANPNQLPALGAIDESLNSIEKWPGKTQQIIEERVAHIHTLEADTVRESATNLRILCIKAEVANGIDSPESEKALRMEYQVEQLQQGFGQGSKGNEQTFNTLAEQWLAVPGVEDGTYHLLCSRFISSFNMGTVIKTEDL